MELFNKSGVLVATVLVAVGILIGVQAKDDMVPPAPVIEATALQMNKNGNVAAERRLREWAGQGSAVARRELALQYQADTSRRDEALKLFEEAARAGDVPAASHLADMHRATRETELNSIKEAAATRTAANSWARY
jgi:TPR repeat protein